MATKKDFTGMKTGNRIETSIEKATGQSGQQTTASPEEAAERMADLRTQGRKGCKAIRINMAFTPDNHEFIKILAKATGRTMTQLTNQVIEAYRNEHPEFLEQCRDFLEFVNNGPFRKVK